MYPEELKGKVYFIPPRFYKNNVVKTIFFGIWPLHKHFHKFELEIFYLRCTTVSDKEVDIGDTVTGI